MTTYDTTFVGKEDALTADNLLQPAKWEIFLLERDGNDFEASQTIIDNNQLYDIGTWGAVTSVAANPF